MKYIYRKGVTVVEIMIGVSLFTMIVISITYTMNVYFMNAGLVQEKTKALYLAEEGQEMLRYLRDEDWAAFSALPTDTLQYLDVATTTLGITPVAEVIEEEYTRSFILRNAYRDTNNDLVASTSPGATVDTDSQLVYVEVAWGTDHSVILEGLLANIFNQ